MSRIPSFSSRPLLPDSLSASCRVVEAFIRIGALPVRFLAVYGYPQKKAHATQMNAALFDQVRTRITESAVPIPFIRPALEKTCHVLAVVAPVMTPPA